MYYINFLIKFKRIFLLYFKFKHIIVLWLKKIIYFSLDYISLFN